jgi:hypothetical protein
LPRLRVPPITIDGAEIRCKLASFFGRPIAAAISGPRPLTLRAMHVRPHSQPRVDNGLMRADPKIGEDLTRSTCCTRWWRHTPRAELKPPR